MGVKADLTELTWGYEIQWIYDRKEETKQEKKEKDEIYMLNSQRSVDT